MNGVPVLRQIQQVGRLSGHPQQAVDQLLATIPPAPTSDGFTRSAYLGVLWERYRLGAAGTGLQRAPVFSDAIRVAGDGPGKRGFSSGLSDIRAFRQERQLLEWLSFSVRRYCGRGDDPDFGQRTPEADFAAWTLIQGLMAVVGFFADTDSLQPIDPVLTKKDKRLLKRNVGIAEYGRLVAFRQRERPRVLSTTALMDMRLNGKTDLLLYLVFMARQGQREASRVLAQVNRSYFPQIADKRSAEKFVWTLPLMRHLVEHARVYGIPFSEDSIKIGPGVSSMLGIGGHLPYVVELCNSYKVAESKYLERDVSRLQYLACQGDRYALDFLIVMSLLEGNFEATRALVEVARMGKAAPSSLTANQTINLTQASRVLASFWV